MQGLAGALSALVFVGCHTPAWRVEQIHEEIDAFDTPRRNAAVEGALAANHAKLAGVEATTVIVMAEVEGCTEPAIDVQLGERLANVDCNAFRNAVLAGGAVDAKRDDGADIALVAAAPLTGDSSGYFVLATTSDGNVLLVRPRKKVVHHRTIWRAGTCDFMPSPVQIGRSAPMFVLPGRRASDVRAVDVAYEGHDTKIVCDERVE